MKIKLKENERKAKMRMEDSKLGSEGLIIYLHEKNELV